MSTTRSWDDIPLFDVDTLTLVTEQPAETGEERTDEHQ